ncbi:Uncharacterised protein [Streptococcus pneumoniae]|nr:Uncharacterised protein [Streptococcus pneumoniae]
MNFVLNGENHESFRSYRFFFLLYQANQEKVIHTFENLFKPRQLYLQISSNHVSSIQKHRQFIATSKLYFEQPTLPSLFFDFH